MSCWIEKTTKGGVKKHEHHHVDCKEFYALVGAGNCYKTNGENGCFYVDNLKIIYIKNNMDVWFEYIVMEWDKNGCGRAQSPKYWWYNDIGIDCTKKTECKDTICLIF